jgi:DNA-binding transcriptional LysR family regulator
MLDARRLRIFCVVAEEGSFTAASTKLFLTQSAVSQQVALLEREIGAPLVERVARGIRLTEVGALLAERAKTVLQDMTSLEQEIKRLVTSPTIVRLGVFSTAGASLVPIVVKRYRQQFSETRLVLHASQPENLENELKESVIDVGLTWDYDFLARPIGALHRQHLLDDPLCLLLPLGHPLASEQSPIRLLDVADEPWVVRNHQPPYHDAFSVMCRAAGFEPNVVFRADDYQSLQGLVAANVGLAVAPRLSIIAQRPDIMIRPIHQPAFTRRIEAVVLPEGRSNPLTRQLLEMLSAVWPEDAKPVPPQL